MNPALAPPAEPVASPETAEPGSDEALVARAKSFEIATEYTPPPGDALEHHTAGFAKTLCSAVFITGLDPDFAAENVGYFTGPYEERHHVTEKRIDRENKAVHLTLDTGVVRTAKYLGDQGCVALAKGETPLMVDGDPAKVQRIVQNLVLNALKVTERGGVKVTWEAGENEHRSQWILCVQDTGPGFKPGTATPLERVLKRATDEAHEVEQQNLPQGETDPQAEAAPTLASQTPYSKTHLSSGEGIGLSIVKRLCEMLDASLELESSEGEGTTFRMIFPRQYPEVREQH